jgi:hypothetical protein
MATFQAMRRWALALVVILAAATTARADGFYTDPHTGLTWSDSLTQLSGSWWTWQPAMQLAAAYSGDEETDWRLPTRQEYFDAAVDGTLQTILPGTPNYVPGTARSLLFWTSDHKGANAYMVEVFYDATGKITNIRQQLVKGNGWAVDAFMVRP